MADKTNTKQAPQVNAPKGAAPGVKEPKAKKEKKKRVAYPGLKNSANEPVKLEALPSDFDPKVHKPLGRKDFANESTFWLLKAANAEKAAAKYKQFAEDAGKAGAVKGNATAKRLLALQRKLAEVEAALTGEIGADAVAALKATAPAAEEVKS